MAEEANVKERLDTLEAKLDEILSKLDTIAPKVQVMEDHVFNVESIARRVPLVRNLMTSSRGNDTFRIAGPSEE